MNSLEVLFSPAEFMALKDRDLSQTICVVFDVLRATSSMITALTNGAQAIVPVAEIPEAIKLKRARPELLLAGERDGLRITSELTGAEDFDLGNSPREFVRSAVNGKTIVMTTTNGTRALRACAHARQVFVSAFLNLAATAKAVESAGASQLLVICSGTFEQAAYEDTLAAGALCELVWPSGSGSLISDSSLMARDLYRFDSKDLPGALARARNGLRLLLRPDLRDDVAFCARLNATDLVATLRESGEVRPL